MSTTLSTYAATLGWLAPFVCSGSIVTNFRSFFLSHLNPEQFLDLLFFFFLENLFIQSKKKKSLNRQKPSFLVFCFKSIVDFNWLNRFVVLCFGGVVVLCEGTRTIWMKQNNIKERERKQNKTHIEPTNCAHFEILLFLFFKKNVERNSQACQFAWLWMRNVLFWNNFGYTFPKLGETCFVCFLLSYTAYIIAQTSHLFIHFFGLLLCTHILLVRRCWLLSFKSPHVWFSVLYFFFHFVSARS